jgi:DNA-binding CsgD family transcriptional regulator
MLFNGKPDNDKIKNMIEIKQSGSSWTNENKVELIRLRLQGLTFKEIGLKMGRTKHSVRSEYGRIRRGETDVIISLRELVELRELLPLKKPVGAKHFQLDQN